MDDAISILQGSCILSLKSKWTFASRCRQLEVHEKDGKVAVCCHAAIMTLHNGITAAARGKGLQGALKFLSHHFKWGVVCDIWVCDALLHRESLSCDAMTVLALDSLDHLRSSYAYSSDEMEMNLYYVELLLSNNSYEASFWRNRISSNNAEGLYSGEGAWLEDACYYHVCVGIESLAGELIIWDFNKVHSRPVDTTMHSAVLSIRISIYPKESLSGKTVLSWEGLKVPLDEWVDNA
jgi:hypothetical protein